ncbi:MAG: YXWGXW repeat-containing protein [Acidobacteriota bacterium]
MNKAEKALLSALFLGCGVLAGCGHAYYGAGITVGPPAPRVIGPLGVAPGPGYVWTDGYYDWQGSNWVWLDGRWARPPRPGRVWVTPYWERHGRGYRFHKGRWR